MTSAPFLLGPWRTAFQWLTSSLVLGLPFLRIDGESALRLDLSERSLYCFGQVFRLEELYLLLFACIVLILFFLLLTLVLGRIWCGWACPQTTLVDLAEALARRIGVKVQNGRMNPRPWQQLLLQLFYLLLALMVGCNLVWYFIDPWSFFSRLGSGQLGVAAALTIAVTAGIVYLDLAWLRRLFCREFCPYGRFQTTLVDPGTLTLRFHPNEAPRCIRCGACTRVCPTAIDIRRGYQIECINCGRCLDACREVMAKRRQPGIIRYTFGSSGRGWRALLNPRLLLVALALFAGTTALALVIGQRAPISLKIARSAAEFRPLDDGQSAVFYTVYLSNRSRQALRLTLQATSAAGELDLRGPTQDRLLAAGGRHKIDFALILPQPAGDSLLTIEFQLLDDQGAILTRADATLRLPQKGLP